MMIMFWRGPGRQAYHRGKPVRQVAYGNCYNCLRAGGLTQICGFCVGENRFNAMVLHDMIDIPCTVVNARFLHRLVGYPDQDHDPTIVGMRPEFEGDLAKARRSTTWPDERLNRYDWRVDEVLELDTFYCRAHWSSRLGSESSFLEDAPQRKVFPYQQTYH